MSGPLGEDAETGGEDRVDHDHLTEKQDYSQEFNKSFVEEVIYESNRYQGDLKVGWKWEIVFLKGKDI